MLIKLDQILIEIAIVDTISLKYELDQNQQSKSAGLKSKLMTIQFGTPNRISLIKSITSFQIDSDTKPMSVYGNKEPFNYKVLERKALAICGLGNQNRLYFYKHLCSITVNWDGKDFRRRVSI